MKIIHVLCEGQTEQGFVEEVLRPYLQVQDVAGVRSILIIINKKKNARGGMLSYTQAVTGLELLWKMKMDGEYKRHVFTTVFNLYVLPDDFPGYGAAKVIGGPYTRVVALEAVSAEVINDSRFTPYVQLHESKALLFRGIDYLAKCYPGCEKRCEQLKKGLEKTSSPGLIDNSPETAPGKRIIKAIGGGKKQYHNYNRPATGKDVTKSVGMDELRARCSHFNEWIEKLIDC